VRAERGQKSGTRCSEPRAVVVVIVVVVVVVVCLVSPKGGREGKREGGGEGKREVEERG